MSQESTRIVANKITYSVTNEVTVRIDLLSTELDVEMELVVEMVDVLNILTRVNLIMYDYPQSPLIMHLLCTQSVTFWFGSEDSGVSCQLSAV